jgi:hypothetical protein
MLQKVSHLFISRAHIAPKALQYADDTIIFVEAHPQNLKLITEIMDLFSQISGLQINRQKTSFYPIAIPEEHHEIIKSILKCNKRCLPMTYLGLPLSIRKPTKIVFQPLVEKVRKKLSAWKGRVLSKGGRLTLVKSTLSAIPIYHMQAFLLPKWLIIQLNSMISSFFWKGSDATKGNGLTHLVKWDTVCRPRVNGGLAVLHLQTQNKALLSKWLWNINNKPTGIWATTLYELYGIENYLQLQFMNNSSFFIKNLTSLIPYFTDSTTIADPATSDKRLSWKWNSNGIYSTASAYQNMRQANTNYPWNVKLGKCKIPEKVKIFAWTSFHNRTLTNDKLISKGWQLSQRCSLCKRGEDSISHILLSCPYSVEVWSKTNPASTTAPYSFADIKELWLNSSQKGKEWNAIFFSTIWNLWKERNRRIFAGEDLPPSRLISIILGEVAL